MLAGLIKLEADGYCCPYEAARRMRSLGMSLKHYTKSHNMNINYFYHWMRKMKGPKEGCLGRPLCPYECRLRFLNTLLTNRGERFRFELTDYPREFTFSGESPLR